MSITNPYNPQIINVFDYGAKGDAAMDGSGAGTDDTAAIQRAFTAWQDSLGGTLRFPAIRPNGAPAAYRITSGITWDIGSGTSIQDYTVDASGAAFRIDIPGAPYDVFSFYNGTKLTWYGGTFYGWNCSMPVNAVPNPIRTLFNASTIDLYNVTAMGFVLSDVAQDNNVALIRAYQLQMKNCSFHSIANSAGKPTVLLPSQWSLLEIEDCSWVDFITYKNQSGSLGQGTGLAIRCDAPNGQTNFSVYGANQVRIKNCLFDEGSGGVKIGADSNTTLAADFTQPNSYYTDPNTSIVTITVADNSWMRLYDVIFIPVGGYYQVRSVNVDGIHADIMNIGVAATGTNAIVGTNIPSAGSPRIYGSYVQSVLVEGCNMNVVPTNNSVGFNFQNVRNALLKDLWIREGNTGSVCIKARHVDLVQVERTYTDPQNAPLDVVDYDSTVLKAVFNDSHMSTAGSNALQTIRDGGRNLGGFLTAANDLVLTKDGDKFAVGGNTTINDISSTGFVGGQEITLIFFGTPLIKHGATPNAGFGRIMLSGGKDFQVSSPTVMKFILDTSDWQQSSGPSSNHS